MEINDVSETIIKISKNIEQILCLYEDIKGKEHIKDYKLCDLQHIDGIIKKCERCGTYFIPSSKLKHHQKYCDNICKNQIECNNNNKIVTSKRNIPIELLRKTIYRRKYRARHSDKHTSMTKYNIILKKLTSLNRIKSQLTDDEYNKQITSIQNEFTRLVQE